MNMWEVATKFTMLVSAEQIVDAAGEFFTITSTDGTPNTFRAYTIVRLNDVPEVH